MKKGAPLSTRRALLSLLKRPPSTRAADAAARAQADEARRELAEVLDDPAVALKLHLGRGDKSPLAPAARVEEYLRVAEAVVLRARAVAQLEDGHGALVEHGQLRPAL